MGYRYVSNHFSNKEGFITGGNTYGPGFTIGWQNGPLLDDKGKIQQQNGAFVEDVISACMDRLRAFQNSKFRCCENQEAMEHLNKVLNALENRTNRRKKEGVDRDWETC